MTRNLVLFLLVILAAPPTHAASCFETLVGRWKQFQLWRNPPVWDRYEGKLKPYQSFLSQFDWKMKTEQVPHTLGSDPFRFWRAGLGGGVTLELRFYGYWEDLHWPQPRSRAGQFTLSIPRSNSAAAQSAFDQLLAVYLITPKERAQLRDETTRDVPDLDNEERFFAAQVYVSTRGDFYQIQFNDPDDLEQVPLTYKRIESVLVKLGLAQRSLK